MFYLTISHSREDLFLLSDHLCVLLFFSVFSNTHTHPLCQRATDMLFLLEAKGELTVSFSWDMIINKVMLPF